MPRKPRTAVAKQDDLVPNHNPFRTYGNTGLRQFSGYVREEFHKNLTGEKAVKVYREMRDNDAVIGAVLFAFESLARNVDFAVKASGKDRASEDAAAFVEECLADINTSWGDFLSEVLTELTYGFALFETVYKVRAGSESRYQDGRIGWRDFGFRSQDSVNHWVFAPDTGALTGFVQSATYGHASAFTDVFIPCEKLVHFRTSSHKNNPEGRSILRNAYRSWYFLKRLQEIEAVGVERDLAGMPVMQVPPALLSTNATAEQRATLDAMFALMQQVRRDEREGLVIPAEEINGQKTGYKFGLINAFGSKGAGVGSDPIIRRYESRMAGSVLADFALLGQDKFGNRALADSKTDIFALALGGLLDGICETFTRQAIHPLMKLNGFHRDVWPYLSHGDIESPVLSELGGFVTQLVGAGVLTPSDALERKLLDAANLPAPEDSGEAIG